MTSAWVGLRNVCRLSESQSLTIDYPGSARTRPTRCRVTPRRQLRTLNQGRLCKSTPTVVFQLRGRSGARGPQGWDLWDGLGEPCRVMGYTGIRNNYTANLRRKQQDQHYFRYPGPGHMHGWGGILNKILRAAYPPRLVYLRVAIYRTAVSHSCTWETQTSG
ncbi:hypothetical protein M011DRAFT_471512 [Sporormia fimetaria CBS 119925]|uniref:Uncharacterized protein n=1 Tax=Sporormia fimetaria CBS 119925 TaxID=1340428 RepID=A0A6A6V0N8_9PLEO|nr:hypothetical protein M011DRAFT_471512 [Sporormia fimetaria CBS 119925]